ncbi:MAG: energy transducer TonB [Blastocatellia bacterium]|nr:energy transducer TonB [Blastocatellia bacterium]
MKYIFRFSFVLVTTLFLVLPMCRLNGLTESAQAQTLPPLTIVVVPFQLVRNDETSPKAVDLEKQLTTVANEALPGAGVELIPASLVQAVMATEAGTLNFNPRLDEARALGAALGCDFYLLGRVSAGPKSGADRTSYHEIRLDVFWVDTRTGALVKWEAVTVTAPTVEPAVTQICETVRKAVAGAIPLLQGYRKEQTTGGTGSAIEPEVLDLRSGQIPTGVAIPVFTKRPRPELTEAAKDAQIEATVETELVFGADGKTDRVQVVRWAGYGLEDAVQKAIAGYGFNPATRDGKPVSVRVLVDYHFRRVTE